MEEAADRSPRAQFEHNLKNSAEGEIWTPTDLRPLDPEATIGINTELTSTHWNTLIFSYFTRLSPVPRMSAYVGIYRGTAGGDGHILGTVMNWMSNAKAVRNESNAKFRK